MTHDYRRHGTLDLFAAMNVANGGVLHDTRAHHTGRDVLAFFSWIDPQPFIWTRTADEIIDKVTRGRATLDRTTKCAVRHIPKTSDIPEFRQVARYTKPEST